MGGRVHWILSQVLVPALAGLKVNHHSGIPIRNPVMNLAWCNALVNNDQPITVN